MTSTGDACPELCVIGAGDAGTAAAIGAIALGLSVVMIDARDDDDFAASDLVLERLRVAACRIDHRRHSGIEISPADFADTMAELRADLPRMTVDRRLTRLAAMNIRVIRGTAAFFGPSRVCVNGEILRARRFIIATGARHPTPPWFLDTSRIGVPSPLAGEGGLRQRRKTDEGSFDVFKARAIPHPALRATVSRGGRRDVSPSNQEGWFEGDRSLSIEDLHRLTVRPDRVVIIGGDRDAWGAAQSLARFGTAVTVLEAGEPDPEIDAELLRPIRQALAREGVRFGKIADITDVAETSTGFILNRTDGQPLAVSHIILAQRGHPALTGLALENAGIRTSGGNLVLDPTLRTTNPRVFALGRAAGARSAQEGQAQVGVVLRAAFFRLPGRFRREVVPHALGTSPALAWVGQSETAARARGPTTILRWPVSETDAGRAGGYPVGHVKIVADSRGRILGAGIIGEGARDVIGFWTLAISRKLTIRDLADIALPIPSLSEASRRAVLTEAARALGSPWIRRALRLARWLG